MTELPILTEPLQLVEVERITGLNSKAARSFCHAVWQFVAAAGRQNAVELSPISGCQFRPIRPDSGR